MSRKAFWRRRSKILVLCQFTALLCKSSLANLGLGFRVLHPPPANLVLVPRTLESLLLLLLLLFSSLRPFRPFGSMHGSAPGPASPASLLPLVVGVGRGHAAGSAAVLGRLRRPSSADVSSLRSNPTKSKSVNCWLPMHQPDLGHRGPRRRLL